ncbi:hypothetical protein [Pseudomonas vancouverensis]|uniref:Uncharacterized protein n=1 Tax=Pseudomonas vancouverensis TaxID=95300 RepID=A0A4R4JXZ5_PSEVA|nr:hypothetical protein [Pseudomonas vancouverensis]KAB0491094.1 hypothetical protein F7R09_25660 [Pseudomonas vancouverensis]TDB59694.1 hypothetical protein EIY72_19000 [Pseudomonas vancouverensis]
MIDSWPPWAAIAFVGGPFILILLSFAYSFYLNRHLDAILGALEKSRHVVLAVGLRNQGWLGRQMLIAKITGVVMWPGPGIRTGQMDPDDIRNFPPNLKRLLKAKAILTCVIVIWGAFAFTLVKFK